MKSVSGWSSKTNERKWEGFGLLGIRRRNEERPIGYCGLIIGRGTVEEPEVAYEVLPQFLLEATVTPRRPLEL